MTKLLDRMTEPGWYLVSNRSGCLPIGPSPLTHLTDLRDQLDSPPNFSGKHGPHYFVCVPPEPELNLGQIAGKAMTDLHGVYWHTLRTTAILGGWEAMIQRHGRPIVDVATHDLIVDGALARFRKLLKEWSEEK